jgi:membrane protease YdiL (CAAX protease family)
MPAIRMDGDAVRQTVGRALLWLSLGAVGVGFGEEMITRGSLIVGLRSRFGEGQVWLISTLLFSALHVPNVIFGLPMLAMPIQVLLTFIVGTGFYVRRRMSGTLDVTDESSWALG